MKLVIEGDNLSEITEKLLNEADRLRGHQVTQQGHNTLAGDLAANCHKPSVPATGTDNNEGSDNFSGLGELTTTTTGTADTFPAPVDKSLTLDKDGVPWDQRIHANSQDQTTNGKWRKRRNVDEELYKTVTAELQAKYKTAAPVDVAPLAPVIPLMPTVATKVEQPVAPATVDQALAHVAPSQAPVAPAVPMQAAVAVQTPITQQVTTPLPIPTQPVNPLTRGYNVQDFGQNITAIVSQLVTDGKLNQQWIENCKATCFGGKEIFEWNQNDKAITDLHHAFVTWKFISNVQV